MRNLTFSMLELKQLMVALLLTCRSWEDTGGRDSSLHHPEEMSCPVHFRYRYCSQGFIAMGTLVGFLGQSPLLENYTTLTVFPSYLLAVAVEQWRSQVRCWMKCHRVIKVCKMDVLPPSFPIQFKLWSTVDERLICRFTSDAKDRPARETILIMFHFISPPPHDVRSLPSNQLTQPSLSVPTPWWHTHRRGPGTLSRWAGQGPSLVPRLPSHARPPPPLPRMGGEPGDEASRGHVVLGGGGDFTLAQ